VAVWSLCPEAILSKKRPDANLQRELRNIDRNFVKVSTNQSSKCAEQNTKRKLISEKIYLRYHLILKW
jgi:hypothetical protein